MHYIISILAKCAMSPKSERRFISLWKFTFTLQAMGTVEGFFDTNMTRTGLVFFDLRY